MRKKMAASFGLWCLILMVLILFALPGKEGFFTITVLVFWLVIPLLSWGMNQYVKRKISVSVLLEPSAFKGQGNRGIIELTNASACSVGRVFCELTVQNRLTGEKDIQLLEGSVPASDKAEIPFRVVSVHCGYLEVQVNEVILHDWFGFLPTRASCEAKGKMSVLPDTFEPMVMLAVSPSYTEDSDSWAENKRGTDYSEVFALRDYVPGDSLKQIHWKLSSKRERLIVREASYPTSRTLLLFWDKNTAETNGEEMDVMAEIVSSICQEISRQGIGYVLAWTEGQECVSEEINTMDELLQVIPRMIKVGGTTQYGSGAALWAERYGYGGYGKAIYFGKKLPEDFVSFSMEDMTFVLSEAVPSTAEGRRISYHTETYLQDLQLVEL